MNSEEPVDYCPYRQNLDWSHVQTQDFSNVKYFQASDSELENDGDVYANGVTYSSQPAPTSGKKSKKKTKKDKKAAQYTYDEPPFAPPDIPAPEPSQDTGVAEDEWPTAPPKKDKKKKKKSKKEETAAASPPPLHPLRPQNQSPNPNLSPSSTLSLLRRKRPL
ncbi:hypothetical protein ColKHC_07363 [Colletotrichum higginsianum]|nr:hypothetical protein ColKHC_07363 [Colletotrichum higginsianum]